MLIDATYFRGILNIPTTGTTERLAWFMEHYEEELLKDVLGLDLYDAFVAGLLADPVDQIWIDLLHGARYVGGDGRNYEWGGLVRDPGAILNSGLKAKRTVVVGRGQLYDPAANAGTTVIPAEMVGKQFVFTQRAFGFLDDDEYTVSGSTLTLSGGRTFSLNDRYYFIPLGISLSSGSGIVKKSLIANYVYYWWLRNNATQTSSVGEVSTKVENAAKTDSRQKQCDAWNEMTYQLWEMWAFLDSKKIDYPDYVRDYLVRNRYSNINVFNL